MLYVPEPFARRNEAEVFDFVEENSFATLI